jgi:hypothetical protein
LEVTNLCPNQSLATGVQVLERGQDKERSLSAGGRLSGAQVHRHGERKLRFSRSCWSCLGRLR